MAKCGTPPLFSPKFFFTKMTQNQLSSNRRAVHTASFIISRVSTLTQVQNISTQYEKCPTWKTEKTLPEQKQAQEEKSPIPLFYLEDQEMNYVAQQVAWHLS